MNKLNIRLIIFDLDGTLIDSKNDIADSVNYTLKSFHLPILENSLIYSYVGNGVLPLIEKEISRSNKNNNLEDALKVFRKHYGEHILDSTRLYPGVMEILKHFSDVNPVREYSSLTTRDGGIGPPSPRNDLYHRQESVAFSNGVNMGLVSNKPERFVKKILKGLNVDCFFPVVIGGDTLKTKKPEPEGVNMVRDRFGVEPRETVIVGDGGVDIETGKEAGIHTCGVSYGLRDRSELVEAGADIIIDDIRELKNHIKV